jgi:chemotaxis protein CheC
MIEKVLNEQEMDSKLITGFDLKPRQKDALQEAGNIAAAHAATALSKIINEKIMIDVTECMLTSVEKIPESFGDVTSEVVAVYMDIQQMEKGFIMILFSHGSAVELCNMFSKIENGKDREISDRDIAVLTEIGNICICAYLNALSKMLDNVLTPTPPMVAKDMIGAILDNIATNASEIDDSAILIETDFIHRYGRSKGQLLFMPDKTFKQMIIKSFDVENV